MPAMIKEAGSTVTPSRSSPRFRYYVENFSLFFLAFLGGLALSRLLYEWLFPQALWLARPYGALPFAALAAYLVWILWLKFTLQPTGAIFHSLTLSPLLLNLFWLFNPTVDLGGSRFIFAASLWLTAVLLFAKQYRSGLIFVLASLLPVYLLSMSHTVGAADTFEFQVVTPKLGIVHPTGYPLYLLLGKLFTLLPAGSIAWRLNFASAVYALAAMALCYFLLYRLTARPSLWPRPLPAILGAAVTGLSLTFWSQAIVAEVYALHALIVMAALCCMAVIGNWQGDASRQAKPAYIYLLAFILGLGLANHITTLFLIPAALFTLLLARRPLQEMAARHHGRFLGKSMAAFLLPLLLYAYLPLRWQAVNGEAMGMARFVDWVSGGRFQGALQWRAWLDDPARYEIVGRLFLDNWGWFNLALAAVGFLFLLWRRRWQTAVPLLLIWSAYTFYALNYYVPDLAVFVIPAQLIVGIWWTMGVMAFTTAVTAKMAIVRHARLQPLLLTFLITPSLLLAVDHWHVNDQSGHDGLTQWGRAVLALPLADGAAILADSEKIAPLLYLQVAERLRPDLDISVWPDEAAYRAQVDGRLAAGQAVYLARYLPGLQAIYHLRAVGPLTEVSAHPLTQLPDHALPLPDALSFGPISLLAYELEPMARIDDSATAVTLYWQAQAPPEAPAPQALHVYLRWQNAVVKAGQHPANNFYPTNAWDLGEVVPDYHLLARPVLAEAQRHNLQVALAPPFTAPDELAWQTITTITLPATHHVKGERPYRAHLGNVLLESATFPGQARPQTILPLLLTGFGYAQTLEFFWQPVSQPAVQPLPSLTINHLPLAVVPFTAGGEIETGSENGRFQLVTTSAGLSTAVCGWMQPATDGCLLGEVDIRGLPLPDTAVNYADKIALLNIDIPDQQLQPGGQLPLRLNWQSLAPVAEDYTVFLQVVDANDRIVGQVDSWPVQGTRPTSRWQPGETVADPYLIQLNQEMPPGTYRLLVGWYLLADGQRLPVLNDEGQPVEDKTTVPGLFVPD